MQENIQIKGYCFHNTLCEPCSLFKTANIEGIRDFLSRIDDYDAKEFVHCLQTIKLDNINKMTAFEAALQLQNKEKIGAFVREFTQYDKKRLERVLALNAEEKPQETTSVRALIQASLTDTPEKCKLNGAYPLHEVAYLHEPTNSDTDLHITAAASITPVSPMSEQTATDTAANSDETPAKLRRSKRNSLNSSSELSKTPVMSKPESESVPKITEKSPKVPRRHSDPRLPTIEEDFDVPATPKRAKRHSISSIVSSITMSQEDTIG